MNINAALALSGFFVGGGGQFKNRNGVVVRVADNKVTISAILEDASKSDGPVYELCDEVNGVESFMTLYQVHSVDDLKLLGTSALWVRYFVEGAEMICTNGYGHSIHFRKFRSSTMVYSMDLNYYNEIGKVMNMLDHFKDFMDENLAKLEVLNSKHDN